MKNLWMLLLIFCFLKPAFSQDIPFKAEIRVDSTQQLGTFTIHLDSLEPQSFCFLKLWIGRRALSLDSLYLDGNTGLICFDMNSNNWVIENPPVVTDKNVIICYLYKDLVQYCSLHLNPAKKIERPLRSLNKQSIDILVINPLNPPDTTIQVHPLMGVLYINVWLEKKDTIEFMPKEIRVGGGFSYPVGYHTARDKLLAQGSPLTGAFKENYFVHCMQAKQMVHMGSLLVDLQALKKYDVSKYNASMNVYYIMKNGKIETFRLNAHLVLK